MQERCLSALLIALALTTCKLRRAPEDSFYLRQSDAVKEIVSQKFPEEILQILNRHNHWISSISGYSVAPNKDAVMPDVMITDAKKWVSVRSGEKLLSLKEITRQSILVHMPDQENQKHKFEYISEEIILSELFNIDWFKAPYYTQLIQKGLKRPFLYENAAEQKYTFRILSEDRIEIEKGASSDDEAKQFVVLIPTEETSYKGLKTSGRKLGLFTGGELDTIAKKEFFETVGKPTYPFYHSRNLEKPVEVLFDKSFPKKYQAVAVEALEEWNRAFRKRFFLVDRREQKLNQVDCLSKRRLCFIWNGPEDFSARGFGGFSSHLTDPSNGEIIGGYIFLQTREEGPTKLKVFSEEERRSWLNVTSLAQIAGNLTNFAQADALLNPFPERIAKMVLLHEIGHSNGFTHNFLGSVSGTLTQSTKTIMDYLPFMHWPEYHLGPWDIGLVDEMYFGKPLSDEYRLCQDHDALLQIQNNRFIGDPHCGYYDIGDPLSWYISAAERGKLKSRSIYPMPLFLVLLRNIHGNSREAIANDPKDPEGSQGDPILYHIARFVDIRPGVTPEESKRASVFLCGELKKNPDLKQRIGSLVRLSCI